MSYSCEKGPLRYKMTSSNDHEFETKRVSVCNDSKKTYIQAGSSECLVPLPENMLKKIEGTLCYFISNSYGCMVQMGNVFFFSLINVTNVNIWILR